MYYDGVEEVQMEIEGELVPNKGPLYIRKHPLYETYLLHGRMDNIQIHNRALTDEEIQYISHSKILYNEYLLLAYNFNRGIING